MVHASKVLLKIIVSRIQLKYLSEINEEQSGFVKGKGTREQMVNIRIIMEKYKEYNIPLSLYIHVLTLTMLRHLIASTISYCTARHAKNGLT